MPFNTLFIETVLISLKLIWTWGKNIYDGTGSSGYEIPENNHNI